VHTVAIGVEHILGGPNAKGSGKAEANPGATRNLRTSSSNADCEISILIPHRPAELNLVERGRVRESDTLFVICQPVDGGIGIALAQIIRSVHQCAQSLSVGANRPNDKTLVFGIVVTTLYGSIKTHGNIKLTRKKTPGL